MSQFGYRSVFAQYVPLNSIYYIEPLFRPKLEAAQHSRYQSSTFFSTVYKLMGFIKTIY